MIDLRSDTVTAPTQRMRDAMAKALVGDDVYGDDPTVCELERKTAKRVGKEAALFVCSGTMGNLVSVLAHTHRNRMAECIAEASCHIYINEVAGAAALAGMQMYPIQGHKGVMALSDIQAAVRAENIHYPVTSLICVENTHNASGGTVQPLDQLRALSGWANKQNLPVHMDGARLFNAAVASGQNVKGIAACADTVSICLSKGLCAPFGAMVCGGRQFIDTARHYRKMVGGLRQAGIMAAAGIVALDEMVDRLAQDHENARTLAEGLCGIDGIEIDLSTVQTNIVRFRTVGKPAEAFADGMAKHGVIFSAHDGAGRMVTHAYVSKEDVQFTLDKAREVMARL